MGPKPSGSESKCPACQDRGPGLPLGSSRNMSPKWVRNPPEVRPNAPEMITQNRRQDRGSAKGAKHESGLSPFGAELGPKSACSTQNKAKQANKIEFLFLLTLI